jgi:hypothetical protein
MDRHETSPVKVLVIGIYVRGNACAPHVRAVVMTAHNRHAQVRSDILDMGGEVDLKTAFIRPSPERTKTKTGRAIPIHPDLMNLFRGLPRALPTNRVFLAMVNLSII